MGQPIGAYEAWWLLGRCYRCGEHEVAMSRYVLHYGGARPLRALIGNLRCSGCGMIPEFLRLQDRPEVERRARPYAVRIERLIGGAAYG